MAEKAKIHILDKDGKQPAAEIEVMYNPRECTISESSEVVKKKTGSLEFQKLNKADFTVSLFYDTYEKREDVREKTREIVDLLRPTVEGKEKRRPKICLFTWGNIEYKGIVTKIDQKFTMFLEKGTPVRAELTVTFKAIESIQEQKDSAAIGACRKLWTVKAGDRLDLIADIALRDVTKWRKIAEVNGILNPLSFPEEEDIGRSIIIPDLYGVK